MYEYEGFDAVMAFAGAGEVVLLIEFPIAVAGALVMLSLSAFEGAAGLPWTHDLADV